MRKDFKESKDKKPFPKRRGKPRKVRSNKPDMDDNKINGSDINLSSNDPAWYMHNDALAQAAGTIPFSYALGNKLGFANMEYVLPGIMSLHIIPAFGRALQMTDPINIAAVKYYSFVRHQNSGHANYDHPDLMMYTLAMGQAYSCLEWMKRMYGYLNTYSVTNRYIPRAYATVDNINFDDFIANLANFNYFINEIAVKLSAFAIPQNFDLFKRHRFMYSNVYMDDRSSRAGLYMFTPDGFYSYDNTTSETGTSLQWKEWTHTAANAYTFAGLVNYVNTLLAKVFGDEDAGIMSGDILKAYGSEAIYTPGAIDFAYSTLPIYDEAILDQIHNATIMSTVVAKPVSQNGFGVIENQQLVPISTTYPREFSGNAIIDTHFDNPTPADVFEMTRLISYRNTIAGNDTSLSVIGGSEIVSGADILRYDYNTDTFVKTTLDGYNAHIPGTQYSLNRLANQLDGISKFNAHPTVVLYNDAASSSYVLGDLDNVSTLNREQIDNLHMTALLSLFGV